MLGNNMGNYPWLADSWPPTNLVHSDKEAVNGCSANHETAERYYNGMNVSWLCMTLNQTNVALFIPICAL